MSRLQHKEKNHGCWCLYCCNWGNFSCFYSKDRKRITHQKMILIFQIYAYCVWFNIIELQTWWKCRAIHPHSLQNGNLHVLTCKLTTWSWNSNRDIWHPTVNETFIARPRKERLKLSKYFSSCTALWMCKRRTRAADRNISFLETLLLSPQHYNPHLSEPQFIAAVWSVRLQLPSLYLHQLAHKL